MSPPGSRAPGGEPSFVGRLRERRLLEGTLEAAVGGAGTAVLLEGGTGIGKTTLLERAARWARGKGTAVLEARGGPSGGGRALGLAESLLRPAVRQAGDDVARGNAGHVVPLLMGEREPGPIPGGTERPAIVLDGLFWLCVNLSERSPLVLLVDDVHLGDPSSSQFLAYLAQRVSSLPALLVLSRRTGMPLAPELEASIEAGTFTRVSLGGLDEAEVGALVNSVAAPATAGEEFTEACTRLTGGNPYFVIEAVRSLLASGRDLTLEALATLELESDEFARAIVERIEALGGGALGVARELAVAHDLGLGGSPGGDPEPAEAGVGGSRTPLEALRNAGVVEPGSVPRLHPLARAAIRKAIPTEELHRLRLDSAIAMRDADAPPERIAAQLLPLEPLDAEWARKALVGAARHAAARGDDRLRARLLERALREPGVGAEDVELRLELAQLELQLGKPEGVRRLEQVLGDTTADPGIRGRAAIGLSRVLVLQGQNRSASEIAARAIDDLRTADPAVAHQLEGELLTGALVDFESWTRLRPRLVELLESDSEARKVGPPLLGALATELALRGDPRRAVELARTAVERTDLRTVDPDSIAIYSAANSLTFAGDPGAAVAVYDRLADAAADRGARRGFAIATCWRALAQLRASDLKRARIDAERSLDAGLEGMPIGLPIVRSVIAECALESADHEAAGAQLETLGDLIADADMLLSLFALATRMRTRTANGDIAGAAADALECRARVERWQLSSPGFVEWQIDAVGALLVAGEREEAVAIAEAAGTAPARSNPHGEVLALRVKAMLADPGDRVGTLEAAVRRAGEAELPALIRGKVAVELGEALVESGDQEQARTVLEAGMDLCFGAGSVAGAERAREALRRTGARPRRLAVTGLAALTAKERDIVELAAAGHTNRQIAEQLFLTKKTVEFHLSNAYRKLGVRGRAQLEDALASGPQ